MVWGMEGDLVDWGVKRGLTEKTTFQNVLKPVSYIPYGACFELKEEWQTIEQIQELFSNI